MMRLTDGDSLTEHAVIAEMRNIRMVGVACESRGRMNHILMQVIERLE
jgi:hypothetical protein